MADKKDVTQVVVKEAPKKVAPKATPDLAKVIEKGFKAPWKHKALWFYGVLLVLFAGGGSYNTSSWGQNNGADMTKGLEAFKSVPVSVWVTMAVIGSVLVLALAILGLIIGSWSLAAIINGNVKLEKGEDITRKDIGKTGKGPIWGLIKLNFFLPMLITLAIIAAVAVVVVLSMVMGQPAGIIFGVTLGIVALLALIPALVYFGIVWIMAARFVVVEGKGALDSISAARELLKGNFWMTFLLSLVAGFIAGMGGCVGSILFFIFVLATVGFAIAKLYVVAAIMGILALAGLVVLITVAGYFKAFTESTVTIWWLDLKKIK
jgi:hypothetical protein